MNDTTDEPRTDSRLEPFVELEQFEIDAASVRLLSEEFCKQYHVVVLGEVAPDGDGPVTVGMRDIRDEHLVSYVNACLQRPVNAVRLNIYEIHKALDIGYGRYRPRRGGSALELKATPGLTFSRDLEVRELVDELLAHAVGLGASDIHIENYQDDVDVRVRIDGILHQLTTPMDAESVIPVVSRLKILANMDIAERRMAQDGRIMASMEDGGDKHPIDFRVSVVPGPFGEDAVLRILDRADPLIGLHRLGFDSPIRARYMEIVSNPEGLVVVAGPTGSGKTTTLYSTLVEVNSETKKVLTVEDPIEYLFAKTNQKQVSKKMGFADYARSFLRQDPDIIMIGEVRDEETADLAMRAAHTGHLVLCSLHANDAVGVVQRLVMLGVEPSLAAETILCSLSQRLVRKICEHCKEEVPADDFAREVFSRTGERFTLFAGRGCPRCRGTGYSGRTGLFELLEVDHHIQEMIGRGVAAHEVRAAARRGGMVTLFEDALIKVRAGVTTFSELRRRVPHRSISEALESLG